MPDLVPTHLHDVIRALKGDRLQPPGDYSIGGQWHMYPPGSEMEKDPLNPPPAPPPTPGFPPASDWMHDKVGQGPLFQRDAANWQGQGGPSAGPYPPLRPNEGWVPDFKDLPQNWEEIQTHQGEKGLRVIPAPKGNENQQPKLEDLIGGLMGVPPQHLQQMAANAPPPKPPPQPIPGVNSLIDWGSSDKLAPMTPPMYWKPG